MKTLLTALYILAFGFSIQAQADKIIGTWYNEPKDSKIKIYKKNNQYYGKVVWLKDNTNDDGSSPKLDNNNADEAKRKLPIVGSIIVMNLVWDEDDQEWDDGEIYDPRGGSTYSAYAKLENPNKLFLKGYIGFSLIGRSTYWFRVSE